MVNVQYGHSAIAELIHKTGERIANKLSEYRKKIVEVRLGYIKELVYFGGDGYDYVPQGVLYIEENHGTKEVKKLFGLMKKQVPNLETLVTIKHETDGHEVKVRSDLKKEELFIIDKEMKKFQRVVPDQDYALLKVVNL